VILIPPDMADEKRHEKYFWPPHASFFRYRPAYASNCMPDRIMSLLSAQDLTTLFGQLMLPAVANLWFKLHQ
jgi:hypothetical protein